MIATEDIENRNNEEPLPGGNEHILLVDDEARIVEFGTRLLERLGYRVTGTVDSLHACKIFKDNPNQFGIIITDNAMTIMDGMELSRKVLSISPDMPILMFTGFGDDITAIEAQDIGVRAFLHKPFTQSKFTRTIRQILDK